jgi:hypothetical protein
MKAMVANVRIMLMLFPQSDSAQILLSWHCSFENANAWRSQVGRSINQTGIELYIGLGYVNWVAQWHASLGQSRSRAMLQYAGSSSTSVMQLRGGGITEEEKVMKVDEDGGYFFTIEGCNAK